MSSDLSTELVRNLTNQDEAAEELNQELSARLKKLADGGSIDVKAMCARGNDVTTVGKLWALNNLLRLAEDGDYIETAYRAGR